MHLHHNCAAARTRTGKIDLKIVGCAAAGVLVPLLLICGGGGAGVYWYYQTEQDKAAKQAERQRLLDAFNPELASYLEMQNLKPVLAKGKFKGKVVCVDKEKMQIDADAQMALPDALKATRPDEVGAVVWLVWTEQEGGEYPDGSLAMIHVVHVSLIDKRTGSALVIGQVIRGDTQETKLSGGGRTGPMPWDKLAALLQQYADSN